MSTLKSDLTAQGVKFLIASFSDMHGVSKAKMVPVDHLDQMMDGSELFTGAALDGVPQDVSDEEVSAHPDASSCIVLPWQKDVAWFASNLWCENKPFDSCSRTILTRVTDQAKEMGYSLNLGIESEFFVFEPTEEGSFEPYSPRHHLSKPAYDVTRLMDNMDWMGELVNAMNDLGWGVYSFDHEDGIGQFEIDFDYADALTMADRFVFLRWMTNAIANRHGAFATFMPKPYGDRAGSGAHFNMSLADLKTGENLFADEADKRGCQLSTLGYQFTAGILRHLPAISAVVAPTVNSYKRLVKQGSMSGFTWAPVFACYGNNNRTNTIRIPKAGKRVELRAADSACNPYLGAAMALAAGLEGIREGLDPGDPHTENMYMKSESELADMGIAMLPRTLEEAIDAFKADPLSKQVFGDAMYGAWTDYKEEEWLSYLNHVSDWEIDRYLNMWG